MPLVHPEAGPELNASQLKPRSIVMIGHDTCKAYATVWVASVGVDYVMFLMGELNTTFLAKRLPDDSLTDDSGKVIRVWEYRGPVGEVGHA
jgi:hypothetical protein